METTPSEEPQFEETEKGAEEPAFEEEEQAGDTGEEESAGLDAAPTGP
ncbi:MAG: hypothetical protein K0R88_692 [Solirubrobacterales bacterium]|jgi:hypothetical protein|nr:hypothetical protein [Solirubrobacterales bacterium]